MIKPWHIVVGVLGLAIIYILMKPRGKLVSGSEANEGTSNSIVGLVSGLVQLGNKLVPPSKNVSTPSTSGPMIFEGPDINSETGEYMLGGGTYA